MAYVTQGPDGQYYVVDENNPGGTPYGSQREAENAYNRLTGGAGFGQPYGGGSTRTAQGGFDPNTYLDRYMGGQRGMQQDAYAAQLQQLLAQGAISKETAEILARSQGEMQQRQLAEDAARRQLAERLGLRQQDIDEAMGYGNLGLGWGNIGLGQMKELADMQKAPASWISQWYLQRGMNPPKDAAQGPPAWMSQAPWDWARNMNSAVRGGTGQPAPGTGNTGRNYSSPTGTIALNLGTMTREQRMALQDQFGPGLEWAGHEGLPMGMTWAEATAKGLLKPGATTGVAYYKVTDPKVLQNPLLQKYLVSGQGTPGSGGDGGIIDPRRGYALGGEGGDAWYKGPMQPGMGYAFGGEGGGGLYDTMLHQYQGGAPGHTTGYAGYDPSKPQPTGGLGSYTRNPASAEPPMPPWLQAQTTGSNLRSWEAPQPGLPNYLRPDQAQGLMPSEWQGLQGLVEGQGGVWGDYLQNMQKSWPKAAQSNISWMGSRAA